MPDRTGALRSFILSDIIFFVTVFIVGLAWVFANQSKNVEGNRCGLFWSTAYRCAKLFMLGLFVQGAQNFGTPYDLSVLRIPGILQRIAWAQLVVTVFELVLPVRDIGFEDTSFFRFYKRYLWHWCACAATLLAYALLMYATPVPGCGAGQATPQVRVYACCLENTYYYSFFVA